MLVSELITCLHSDSTIDSTLTSYLSQVRSSLTRFQQEVIREQEERRSQGTLSLSLCLRGASPPWSQFLLKNSTLWRVNIQ